MTIAPEPTREPTRAPMPAAPKGFEAIRVLELHFCQPNGRDVPPLRNANGGNWRQIRAGTKGSVTTEIQYEPWQRHHRVRETRDGSVVEVCIHESWVLYVPDLGG